MYLDTVDQVLWKYTASNALRSDDLSTWLEGLTSGIEAVQGSGIRYVE